jgi:formylglycine-generating enzyme required for sulfatase activity/tRNA A-37 threonylcarbamoyl transferase component Bud32
MHPAVAAVAAAHGLSAEAVSALEAALRQAASEGPAGSPDRYEDLGPLGAGGMGEVRRVRDRVLNRVLARKLVHPALVQRPLSLARFVEEAKATAQLQHPGIVPVHDLGTLPDGRVWFTMKEVDGRTLTEVLREVHAASRERWETTRTGWSLRRMVDAVHAACRAVAYAHERGVVHRDLKPDNVMVGRHGEVYVLDWGLAKLLGRPAPSDGARDEEPVVVGRSIEHATRIGQVAGTPAYMPPEQARGEVDRIDARSDVYALGAVLYEVLGGRPPYEGSGRMVLAQLLAGPPPPVGRGASVTLGFGLEDEPALGPTAPEELAAACARAMARDPEDRFPSASALADAIQSWLDGSRLREQALAVVGRAAALEAEAAALEAEATALGAEAAALLAGVAPFEPEARKAAGWAKQDAAAAAAQGARLKQAGVQALLAAALQHAPDLPEAHERLAARHRSRFDAAEAARDVGAAAEARVALESHLGALPESHPARAEGARWLRGDGALTLETDPPGAEVLLVRYELRNRRLVEGPPRSLGPTPLRRVPLPMGSYLCVLRHPERTEVRYPVRIERCGHWDGVPPEGRGPLPVPLPAPGALGPDDRYVPAGWWWSGGDPAALHSLPRRRTWLDGWVFRRFPVTNREFLAFLDDLVARGRVEEALRWAPRERASVEEAPGATIYSFDGARFGLRPDLDGHLWDPDWPVVMVDWFGASAFAAWEAERTGQAWQLPPELAWEKAARGVDGRWYPWGDAFDASWACLQPSHAARPSPSRVDAFPVDESVYGIRGLAGNTRDWCVDPFRPEGAPFGAGRPALAAPPDAPRVDRGGAWASRPELARVSFRFRDPPAHRNGVLGFRLARPFPSGPSPDRAATR